MQRWAVEQEGSPHLSVRSVDVALLEGALARLGRLGGGVVLALLRVAVGLGTLQQRLLGRLLVLGLALQLSHARSVLPSRRLCAC